MSTIPNISVGREIMTKEQTVEDAQHFIQCDFWGCYISDVNGECKEVLYDDRRTDIETREELDKKRMDIHNGIDEILMICQEKNEVLCIVLGYKNFRNLHYFPNSDGTFEKVDINFIDFLKTNTVEMCVVIVKDITTYIKKVLDTISNLNVYPPSIFEEKTPNYWIMKTKKYPMTIGKYIDEHNPNIPELEKKIDGLIDILHSHNILHGDLHAENIVIDPSTMDVRIIDFEDGHTKFFSDITEADIGKISKFFEAENELKTLEDVKKYERNMWKIGYID
jgi:tRNA A-37 threonylcarbamoyl transferase component Bud32